MRQTRPSRPLPPRGELANVFEFEDMAKRVLPGEVFATIAGSDRAAFDRFTFRPRMMIPVLDMDLSVELLGTKHFTPILIGPVVEQRQFHRDGELATARGAAAARAAMVVSSRSSVPIDQLSAEARTPLWYACYANEVDAPKHAHQAVAAGCTAVCVTIQLDGPRATSGASTDWNRVDSIRQGLNVPVLIKGVMTPEDAQRAIDRGASGLVVSNHGGVVAGKAPIEVLAAIADTVGGKAPVLIDGSFRRGTDILMALVLGARGVLLARPVMWGLAAYGSEGVQSVVELLQSDLARNFALLGASNLASLNRSMVKLHRQ
jgi:4-hydroxymandelate oxidase